MDAAVIIQFNKALETAMPQTQFLWYPSTSDKKYRYIASFTDNSINDIVATVKEHCCNQDLVQLTIHNKTVYYC
jgi:hypothetical protein